MFLIELVTGNLTVTNILPMQPLSSYDYNKLPELSIKGAVDALQDKVTTLESEVTQLR